MPPLWRTAVTSTSSCRPNLIFGLHPISRPESTYLFRAYNKWCADNLEKPVAQKKFSQYLFKNAERYGIRFSKHVEGGFRGYRGVYVRPDCALE